MTLIYPSRVRRGRGSRRLAPLGHLFAAVLCATPSAAIAQPPDSSGYVTVEGGSRVYFEVHGRARDTVIVPGGVILAPHLSALRTEFAVVFYDPRGRGKSDWVDDAR